VYAGQLKNGTREGKGTLNQRDGQKYAGEFRNDYFDGMGRLIIPGTGPCLRAVHTWDCLGFPRWLN